MTDDPYVYPGTNVLRNALGIRDDGELERVESQLTRIRAARLMATPLPGSYDLAHLQAFHRVLFDGLYDWAGQLRTVPIARAQMFCLPEYIEGYAADVFGRLAREQHLVALGRARFVDRLAAYLGDVNALHPFRDGNGRAQRACFAQLAGDAGYRLHWSRVDRERNGEAFIAAMRGDERPLRELLDEITTPM